MIPEPIPMPEPSLGTVPVPTPEPILELILDPILILEPIPETNSEPTIRNRFEKTYELARIDSEQNFFFPITSGHNPIKGRFVVI